MKLTQIRNAIPRVSWIGFTALTSLILLGGFENCTPSFQTLASQKADLSEATVALGPLRNMSAALSPLPSVNWDAQTDSLFDPVLFQWEFYLDVNPDLRRAGIVDEQGAQQHWQNYGIHEGRAASPNFHARDYLYLNPDLTQAFAQTSDPYGNVINHYRQYGRRENRQKVVPNAYGFDRGYGDTLFGNEQIYICTESRYAGTMTDFVFRGVNFENNHDSGRLFQSALFFADSPNQLTDCENPNEAGMGADGSGPVSHSNLQYTSAVNGSLGAITAPAYWFTPGTTQFCGVARGQQIVSNTLIAKNVTVGFEGDSQIVYWRTTSQFPQGNRAVFRLEAQTAYLTLGSNQPANFSNVFGFNPWTSQLEASTAAEIGVDSYESSTHAYPTVYTTADGTYAMGVYGIDQEWQTPDNITRYPTYHQAKHSINIGDATDATTKWSLYYDV